MSIRHSCRRLVAITRTHPSTHRWAPQHPSTALPRCTWDSVTSTESSIIFSPLRFRHSLCNPSLLIHKHSPLNSPSLLSPRICHCDLYIVTQHIDSAVCRMFSLSRLSLLLQCNAHIHHMGHPPYLIGRVKSGETFRLHLRFSLSPSPPKQRPLDISQKRFILFYFFSSFFVAVIRRTSLSNDSPKIGPTVLVSPIFILLLV